MVEGAKNKGGRPPQGPKSGKGATLATRITLETREALDEEAARTGRSVSQVAEIWLDEARHGRAQYNQLLGGSARTAANIEALVQIAREVQSEFKDEESVAIALRAGWLRAIFRLLPEPVIVKNWLKYLPLVTEAWEACHNVLVALDLAGETDPVYVRATQPLAAAGGLVTSRHIANRLADVLRMPDQFNAFLSYRAPDLDVKMALEALRAAGTTARPEIDVALALVGKLVASEGKARVKIAGATALGEVIADSVVGRAQ